MWVIEMLGYMQDLPATNERAPNGRISVLEDTNRDGKMDKKTVFLDRLVLPRALKVLDKGVLVGEPPHLWLARDTNGDLKADNKELVCDCYGTELGNVEHNENSLLWAMDNWMHTSEGDTYLPLQGRKVRDAEDAVARPVGRVAGRFRARLSQLEQLGAARRSGVRRRTLPRNPNLLRTRGSYEFMGDPAELNATFPVRPNRGVNRGYQTGQLRADGTLATYTAVCSPMVYRGDRLPAELSGNVFIAEPAGNLVSRIIVSDDGTSSRRGRPTTRRVPRVDRRAVPAGLPVRRRRTARSTSSTCTTASSSRKASSPSTCATTSSRASSSSRLTWAASGGSCTTRRGATRRRRSRRESAAQLVERLVAPERLVARHGAAAARPARRPDRRAGAEEARRGGAGSADAAARAVDAGRTGQPRARRS